VLGEQNWAQQIQGIQESAVRGELWKVQELLQGFEVQSGKFFGQLLWKELPDFNPVR